MASAGRLAKVAVIGISIIYALGVTVTGLRTENGWGSAARWPLRLISQPTAPLVAVTTEYAQLGGYLVFAPDEVLWSVARTAGLEGTAGAFFRATDAVVGARRTGLAAAGPDVSRTVASLLREALEAGAAADREELNLIHPKLGDQFEDLLMAGVRDALGALEGGGAEQFARSQVAFHRWSSLWNADGGVVQRRLALAHGLDAGAGGQSVP